MPYIIVMMLNTNTKTSEIKTSDCVKLSAEMVSVCAMFGSVADFAVSHEHGRAFESDDIEDTSWIDSSL